MNGMFPHRSALLSLVAFCLFAHGVSAESPEDRARRYVSLAADGQFEGSAGPNKFERRIRNLLRVRCLGNAGSVVRSADVRQDTALVALDVAFTKRHRQTGEEMAMEVIPLRLELVRKGETWLVAKATLIDDELADELLSAEGGQMTALIASGGIYPSTSRALVERG